MPYIEVTLSKSLNAQEKDQLKSKLGELISIIPGKTESVLMIHINEDASLYFGGEKNDTIAYMVIKLYKESAFEHKAAFAKQVYAYMEQACGVSPDSFFLNFEVHNAWGFHGALNNQ